MILISSNCLINMKNEVDNHTSWSKIKNMGNQNTSTVALLWNTIPASESLLDWWYHGLYALFSRQDPQGYLFPYEENIVEAPSLILRFPRIPIQLQIGTVTVTQADCRGAARDQLGEAFRMPNTNGMNLLSVLHQGMYYVSQIWANQELLM